MRRRRVRRPAPHDWAWHEEQMSRGFRSPRDGRIFSWEEIEKNAKCWFTMGWDELPEEERRRSSMPMPEDRPRR